MKMQYANINGIKIAYDVRGSGPPLVLIMGYRLSSRAWPLNFIEVLAKRFQVVIFDNRGTGASDKPTIGYDISNMARDVCGLLDHLEVPRANVLGYSMGGAIAQEFTRQFPGRVVSLVLCATMCGGARAIYASPPVVRVMRELDGLKPEEIARRIWHVTYAPGYLKKHRELAEDQMRREIAAPTPLHAADLQFQAFAEFDSSKALPNIQSPTLVLTGDLDQLVSPKNSRIIASLIPGAHLIVIPGCGHRVMWEATDECVEIVTDFVANSLNGVIAPVSPTEPDQVSNFVDFIIPAVELFAKWPWMLAGAGVDSMAIARQSIYFGGKAQFGDGKPVILLPQISNAPSFTLLSNWLTVLGYRPTTADISAEFNDPSISNLICEVTQRIGRKAILVAPPSGLQRAFTIAAAHEESISDLVVLNSPPRADKHPRIRLHYISSGWSLHFAMVALPQVLRNIPIELIRSPDSTVPEAAHSESLPFSRATLQISAGEQR
jgi:3-oxoadipate enol-lactonase